MKNFKNYVLILIALAFISVTGCKKDTQESSGFANDYSAEVPISWHQLLEHIDRYSPGYRPPASSRMFGFIGLSAYESIVHGIPGNRSLAPHFAGLFLPIPEPGKDYHWPSALNASYHSMFGYAYPHISKGDKDRIRDHNQSMEATLLTQTSPETYNRSKAFGEAIAEAIFTWSKTDVAGHEAFYDPNPVSYQPPQGPGLWQPTWPDFTPALFPYWGQVRTFAMNNADLVAYPPLTWSENPQSQFYKQAKETYDWVNEIKSGNDDDGHWMAEFWSDDFEGVTFTPPGRMLAIATQIIQKEKTPMGRAVEIYARMGMALADAAIAVWNSKYLYNVERPINYIRRNMDNSWETIMNNPATGEKGLNPPFPAYPSGHSGFAGAGAAVLAQFYGNTYQFTDNCHKNRTEFLGTPRSFNSFTQLAEEDAYSRLPMGVHYRMDCDEGLRMGYLAAQRVSQLPWN
jgi:hypothetical protein